jgi:hypothetical protein
VRNGRRVLLQSAKKLSGTIIGRQRRPQFSSRAFLTPGQVIPSGVAAPPSGVAAPELAAADRAGRTAGRGGRAARSWWPGPAARVVRDSGSALAELPRPNRRASAALGGRAVAR